MLRIMSVGALLAANCEGYLMQQPHAEFASSFLSDEPNGVCKEEDHQNAESINEKVMESLKKATDPKKYKICSTVVLDVCKQFGCTLDTQKGLDRTKDDILHRCPIAQRIAESYVETMTGAIGEEKKTEEELKEAIKEQMSGQSRATKQNLSLMCAEAFETLKEKRDAIVEEVKKVRAEAKEAEAAAETPEKKEEFCDKDKHLKPPKLGECNVYCEPQTSSRPWYERIGSTEAEIVKKSDCVDGFFCNPVGFPAGEAHCMPKSFWSSGAFVYFKGGER